MTGQVKIEQHDLSAGYVVFRVLGVDLSQRPRLAEEALGQWLKRNREFKVRAALPINSEGNTVSIHVWFD